MMFIASNPSAGARGNTPSFNRGRFDSRRAATLAVCSIVLLGAASLSACAADQAAAGPRYTAAVNPTLQSVTDAVLADASQRTGLEVAKLQVVESVAVTWPDGSLGCPEPGMNYTMALVPGYRIRIKVGEQVLNYHTSMRGFWVFCPLGRAVEPTPSDAM